jgi:hypothetical protein
MRWRGIFWQRIPSVLYREMKILALRENKPYTDSFSLLGTPVNTGKPRQSRLFTSCEKYA